jgi:putative membrane protein
VTPAAASQAQAPAAPVTDPRIYFAAERTLLAWIRTGVAMMGFGFVVAKFTTGTSAQPAKVSLQFGTALVLMGTVVSLLSALHFMRQVRKLRTGTWSPDDTSRWGPAAAIALALIGVAVTTHLLLA